MIKFISKNIKPLLPSFIFEPLRRILTAILTPVFFSIDSGHFKSSIRASACDSSSKPICWFTYPAIDFLDRFNFKNLFILEFGSGQSTLWWQNKGAKIISFENNEGWFNKISQNISQNNSVNLIKNDTLDNQQLDLIKKTNQHDVLIIDGSYNRFDALSLAIPYLSEKAIVILDNSEGYYTGSGQDKYGYFPMLKLMKSENFNRVDFFGYAPGVILPHCTSIFFKNTSFIFHQENLPKISKHSLYYKDRELKNLI